MTAAAAAAISAALKCWDREGIVGGGKRLAMWLECMISRNLSESRECDRMWRVNLFWLGNEAGQYMQGNMILLLWLPLPAPGLPDAEGEGEGDKELAGEETPRPSARPPNPPPPPLPSPPNPPLPPPLPATNPPPLEPAPPTTDVASAATVASCNQTRTETVNFLLFIQYFVVVVVHRLIMSLLFAYFFKKWFDRIRYIYMYIFII